MMQKKIEELIKLHIYPICEYPSGIPDAEELPLVTFGAADIAANEIAKLFERKVIWEGEAYVDGFGRIRFLDSQSGELPILTVDDEELPGEMFYPELAAGKGTILPLAGQRVRVVVEEIDESRT